jgi:hypothetical protein
MQMRRKAGRSLHRRQVARLRIIVQNIRQIGQAFLRADLSRRPFLPETLCPIRLGRQQLPVIQTVAFRPAFRCFQMFRLRQWIARRHMLEHSTGKGSVDAIGLSRTAGHGSRRQEVITVMADEFQPFRNPEFRIAPPGLVMMEAMYPLGAHLFRKAC